MAVFPVEPIWLEQWILWYSKGNALYQWSLYKMDFSDYSGVVDYTVTTWIYYILSFNCNLPLCILAHIVLIMASLPICLQFKLSTILWMNLNISIWHFVQCWTSETLEWPVPYNTYKGQFWWFEISIEDCSWGKSDITNHLTC